MCYSVLILKFILSYMFKNGINVSDISVKLLMSFLFGHFIPHNYLFDGVNFAARLIERVR